MIEYKYTHHLCSLINSLCDPEKVHEFSFDNDLIRYITNDYEIRILLHQHNGIGTSAIRFRDSNWNQVPLIELVKYENSDYFNSSLIVPINLDIDSVRSIVEECLKIITETNKTILVILESNS